VTELLVGVESLAPAGLFKEKEMTLTRQILNGLFIGLLASPGAILAILWIQEALR